MAGNLDAFCERCGKTAVSPLAMNRTGNSSGLRRLLPGAKSGKAAKAAAAATDSAALRLCLGCRGYICTDCWNDDSGVCQTCQPLEGTGVAVAVELDEDPVEPGLEIVDYDAEGAALPANQASAWPASDLVREPAWQAAEALPADPVAEREPEPELEADAFEDRWEELLNRVQAIGVAGDAAAEVAPEPEPEQEPEPEPTFEALAVAEPAPEPTFEAEAEPEPDAVVEAEPEPDSMFQAEPEPEAVFEAEPEPEASFEAEPEPGPTLAEPEAVVEPDAVLEAQPEPTFAPEPEPEPVFAVQPEPEPEPAFEVEPLVEAETESETVAATAVEPGPVLEAVTETVAAPEPVVTDPEEDLWAAVLANPADDTRADPSEPDTSELSKALQPRRVRHRVARAVPRRVARPSTFFSVPEVQPQPVQRPEPVEVPTPPVVAKPLRLPPVLPPRAPSPVAPWPMQVPPGFVPPPPPPTMMSQVQPAPARFRPQIPVVEEAPKLPTTRPCTKCGLELSAKVGFCRRCGTRQAPLV